MPVTRTASRALDRSLRKHIINVRRKRALKEALTSCKEKPTAASVSKAFSFIDKAAKWGLMHDNKAARMKSQLSSLIK